MKLGMFLTNALCRKVGTSRIGKQTIGRFVLFAKILQPNFLNRFFFLYIICCGEEVLLPRRIYWYWSWDRSSQSSQVFFKELPNFSYTGRNYFVIQENLPSETLLMPVILLISAAKLTEPVTYYSWFAKVAALLSS